MIPIIGIMIGFYVITRMAEIMTLPKDVSRGLVVNVLAAITFLVAAISIVMLITASNDMTTRLSPFLK